LIELLCDDGHEDLEVQPGAVTLACILAIITRRSELAPGLSPVQLKELSAGMGEPPHDVVEWLRSTTRFEDLILRVMGARIRGTTAADRVCIGLWEARSFCGRVLEAIWDKTENNRARQDANVRITARLWGLLQRCVASVRDDVPTRVTKIHLDDWLLTSMDDRAMFDPVLGPAPASAPGHHP
jgi:hypothetical protein